MASRRSVVGQPEHLAKACRASRAEIFLDHDLFGDRHLLHTWASLPTIFNVTAYKDGVGRANCSS